MEPEETQSTSGKHHHNVHPIKLSLLEGATNATLKINKGFFILDEQHESTFDVGEIGSATYGLTCKEVRLRIDAGIQLKAVAVVYVQSPNEYFDGWLERDKRNADGQVAVESPDGNGETDYLLPGQTCRRVTLPLLPAAEQPCD